MTKIFAGLRPAPHHLGPRLTEIAVSLQCHFGCHDPGLSPKRKSGLQGHFLALTVRSAASRRQARTWSGRVLVETPTYRVGTTENLVRWRVAAEGESRARAVCGVECSIVGSLYHVLWTMDRVGSCLPFLWPCISHAAPQLPARRARGCHVLLPGALHAGQRR